MVLWLYIHVQLDDITIPNEKAMDPMIFWSFPRLGSLEDPPPLVKNIGLDSLGFGKSGWQVRTINIMHELLIKNQE